MKTLYQLFFIIIFTVNSYAAEYYVSKTGRDINSGTTDKPFLTIAKALSVVNPGDTVYIKYGIYRENGLSLNRSGTSANKIIIKNFDNNLPIVENGYLLKNWTVYSENIFSKQMNTEEEKGLIGDTSSIFVGNKLLTKSDNISSLTPGNWYEENSVIYIWPHDSLSPNYNNRRVLLLGGDDTRNILEIYGNHITIEGLIFRYSYGSAIRCSGVNVVINRCKVYFAQKHGIYTYLNHNNNVLPKNVTISNCYIHDNVLNNSKKNDSGYGSGIKIESGSYINIYNNKVYRNIGEGISSQGNNVDQVKYHGTNNIKIRRNTVYDNYKVNIYLDHATNATIDSNYIYRSDQFNLGPNKTYGILLAEEIGEKEYGFNGDLNNGIIANNIVENCYTGIHFKQYNKINLQSGLDKFIIANNTIVNSDEFELQIDGGLHNLAIFNNIFSSNIKNDIIYLPNPTNNIHFYNNYFYNKDKSTNSLVIQLVDFDYNYTSVPFTTWKSLPGNESSGFVNDPLFINGNPTVNTANNYSLNINSPCIDSGIHINAVGSSLPIELLLKFSNLNSFNRQVRGETAIDVGAFEM